MENREAIEILSRPFSMQEAPKEILDAHRLAISALEKQEAIKSCTPPSDDWEHYADRLHDIAYQSGYEQGKKDAEQDKWIPVMERLPEENGTYLACYEDATVLLDWFNGKWFFYRTNPAVEETGTIIAWRPLPEPYTEEANDKP